MKKLKLLLLVVLLCGFALNSNAQSVPHPFERPLNNPWDLKINCDGVEDVLSGPVHGHVVDHFNPKTGVFEWYKFNFTGELVSKNTEEAFSVNFFQKGDHDPDVYVETKRFNLRGNQGSHILVTVIWFWDNNTSTFGIIKKTVKCI